MALIHFIALALVACATASSEEKVTTPVPTGRFAGTLGILPYTQVGSDFKCLNCPQPVYTLTTVNFSGTSMDVYIEYKATGGCSVARQQYTVYNVQPHSGGAYPNYYGGQIYMGTLIPVCFYFGPNSAGSYNIVIKLDGQGSCPLAADAPSCLPAGGKVTQTWSGTVVPDKFPSGNFHGTLTVQPYTTVSGGAQCLQCFVSPKATYAWYPSSNALVITTVATSASGCTWPATTFTFSNLDSYGPSYPGYFRGTYTPTGTTQSFYVCFFFSKVGNTNYFAITLDGQGSCPAVPPQASCTPIAGGYVTQVISGTYS